MHAEEPTRTELNDPEVVWPISVVTAQGLQSALAEEVRSLVDAKVSDRPFGVQIEATPAQAYHVVCDSLIAGHVYLSIATGRAEDADQLYDLGQSVDWSRQFPVDATFAISATGTTAALRHTGFIVTRLKDAIVDQFRDRTGRRPDIDTDTPDVRIHCHVTQAGQCTISIELSNGSLHRRGYRTEGGLAPLRENLAAALLWRARWPEIGAPADGSRSALFDPMCGSGTLLIEAALRIYGQPDSMRRQRIGSPGWTGHDRMAQEQVLDAPAPCLLQADAEPPILIGRDHDAGQIAAARANVRRAGFEDQILLEVADAWSAPCPDDFSTIGSGLVISNLPYGKRIPGPEEQGALRQQWSGLVDHWQKCIPGWAWAMLMPEGQSGDWPLRYEKAFDFDNGGTAVQLLRGIIDPTQRRETPGPRGLATRLLAQARQAGLGDTSEAEALRNRLRKNLKHIRRIAQRQDWSCYRLYDADLPEFNVAVDRYLDETGTEWVDIQEYQAPAKVDPQLARQRLAIAVLCIQEVLDADEDHLLVRQRRRQTGKGQYGRMAEERVRRVVVEGRDAGATRLWINLTDYLDTGLFLDHRLVRDRVAELAQGKSLLNLFCYTASASVRAAVAGAEHTVSIDLSNTYLDWANDNFELNGIRASRADRNAQHRLIRSDVLSWLETASARPEAREGFDVIFCDPPSFSNSKTMNDVLDIQRDHDRIVRQCMRLLKPDGTLIFSNNLKGFKLADELQNDFQVDDISRKTLPDDFARTPNRRSVFVIRHAD